MSAFLGKVHYWLYSKIQLHEDLADSIIDVGQKSGIDMNHIMESVNIKYGSPVRGNLDNVIDQGNIHGSLQELIESVESRIADMVVFLEKNGLDIEVLKNLYLSKGQLYGEHVSKTDASLYEIYNSLYNHLLEGMPCDRVNQIVQDSDEVFVWETSTCLHQKFWNDDIGIYYELNDSFINGFIKAYDEGLVYKRDNKLKMIER